MSEEDAGFPQTVSGRLYPGLRAARHDGFPKAHEVFDGNRNDSTTVEDMLTALEKRVGKRAGATVTVDRGMAFDKNIEQIRSRGYHYLVAARPVLRVALRNTSSLTIQGSQTYSKANTQSQSH
jgi:transposase